MKNDNQADNMRHSLSHILAQAVLKFYPNAKLAIGPAIENGFYYDIDFGAESLTPEDLKKTEKEMHGIVNQDQKFEQFDLSVKEAKEKLKNNEYKLEMIDELEKGGEKKISFYKNINHKGEETFVDMCVGPHVETTKAVGAFKLQKLAGAYWRGDEKNKMLQRIYGLAFATQEELDAYLKNLEEAEKRDHRKLGEQLDLFVVSELVGPGLPLYTFKGAAILRELRKYINSLQSGIGYQEVQTPNMNRAELFKVSGHYEKYKDDMFKVTSHYSKEEYFLKPMNCPQHTQIYAAKPRSYKDLPIRIADFCQLHRDEKTGELSGLTRLRGFSQDDGHCFCREDQIKDEFKAVLMVIGKAMETFGMNYKIRLSLWDPEKPEKYLGDAKVWEKSQKLLEEILIENKVEHVKAVGEAAIYGPKMDLISRDSLGREWQLSTIQLDFIMPERFKLTYIDSDGKEKTPVMIHRAIVGSPERFLGILIEHFAGAFPFWLAPVQAKVLPISEKFEKYAQEVFAELKKNNLRVELDDSAESLGKRIRNGEREKIPYLLVVGEKEEQSRTVAVRKRGEGDLGAVEFGSLMEKMV